ncbi:hypothetical protein [Enterobacter kobei]|uniref:hypothetical protein n=1 Tax=Enterobacter kobei TaxID=208224 RepID=UPI003CF64570
MFAEISASLTVIKEALSLVKIISESKSEAEVQQATWNLRDNLASLQIKNLELIEVISSQNERISALQKELTEHTRFETESRRYSPYTLDTGTFTYVNNSAKNPEVKPHYLCAHCYKKSVIEILCPTGKDTTIHGNYYPLYSCPSCKNRYVMEWRFNPSAFNSPDKADE